MIAALLAMDFVWAVGLVGVSIPAAYAAHAAFLALEARVGAPGALVGGLVVFVATYVTDVCVVMALLPAPRPGKHPLLRGRDFFLWSAGLIVRRFLDVAPIGTLVRQSAFARLVMLRAAGARVSPSANMSSDVLVLDPNMFELGPKTLLGTGVLISGHMVVDGTLTLAPVVIGEGAECGADVRVAPGVRIGARAMVQSAAVLAPFVDVGEGAVVGLRAVLGARCKIGAGAKVAPNAYVPAGTEVAAGAAFP